MTIGLNKKQTNWAKAIVSIAVTLAAMPLVHLLARMLKDGTTGVEQLFFMGHESALWFRYGHHPQDRRGSVRSYQPSSYFMERFRRTYTPNSSDRGSFAGAGLYVTYRKMMRRV